MRRSARVALLALLAAAVWAGCAGVPLPGSGPSEEERSALASALETLERDPRAGEQRLEAFLARWPESPLASDASLRLGERALERKDLEAAQRHIDAVLRRPRSRAQEDRARLRGAQIALLRNDPRGAEGLLARVRVSRLDGAEQREAYRALVDSAPDEVTRLRRLAGLRAFEEEADAVARVDVEIDRVIGGLEARDLARAADQLGEEIPAARVWMRQAALALDADDPAAAAELLERAAEQPIAPQYAARLDDLRLRLRTHDAGAPEGEALPTFSELRGVPLPSTDGAEGALGVVLPLSGPLADFGEETLQGILLAAQVFEESGGSAVRVVVRDSRGRPEGAVEAVRELAEDGEVSAILGPLAAAECEAAAAAAERARIPLLALTSREEIAASRPYVLRLRTLPREEVETLVEHAMDQGARRFAILYPNDAYGRGLRNLFWDAVERRQGAVVGVARYDPEATDFADPIRQLLGYVLLSPEEKATLAKREKMLKRARRLPAEQAAALRREARSLTAPGGGALPPIVDFDALFIPESHEKVVLIAPQLAFHEAGNVRLLGSSSWHHPDLVPIARHHVDGALFTAHFFEESEVLWVRDFARRYRETYDAAPEAFAAQGYDAATLALDQLARGHRSRDELRQALLSVRNFPGVTGVLSMRPDGNARKRPFLLAVERGHVLQVE